MIQATMADMRKSVDFFQTDQVINIINGRKKQEIGYFVPNIFKADFLEFLKKIEQEKRLKNAKRAANAQMLDPVGDGTAGDGIE
ncbi:MAG: hypothetical protein DSY43_01055 [Gammaproteobacteria bacterium]|uniref:Uncharacterized protein n=1 Tax=endosymbiont of Bathymodiolus septemdierum str. Myojin knoll TaxID=1303921 RepID=A0A0N7KBK8_9GAMM|nr:hypothetical protein [Bathymodiolus septemdierum thioautotrophic gill symbiont]RUA06878.1 MAG: hypothetical protein DSY43_01055 [Gammaproteobacteria bacterium]BAS68295.1 conserved hypothetical protein [endosymbiont of Bathymodiolus septemdierum str. Myojin knoll]